MSTTQPIRDKEKLKQFMNYYLVDCPKPRNYALIVLSLHTALRISDVLSLKWEMIYDFEKKLFRNHLSVLEKKTGKTNVIAINSLIISALKAYFKEQKPHAGDYIFTKTTNYSAPLSRSQAFRIIKKAADSSLGIPNISCHSLRKTFGYHAWKQGTPPAPLMDIYNHSSYAVTKKYLGITQDERDSIFMKINF